MVSQVSGESIQAIGYKMATAVACAVLIGVFNLLDQQKEVKYEQLREECLALGDTFIPGEASVVSKAENRTRLACAQ